MAGPRPPAGRLFIMMLVKHYLAARDGDETRRAMIFDFLDSFSHEFPDEVEQEIAYWLKQGGSKQ